MERLSVLAGAAPVPALARASWESRRVMRALRRRFGLSGWIIAACCGCTALALAFAADREKQAHAFGAAQAVRQARPVAAVPVPAPDRHAISHARLRAFDRHVLPHEEIPAVVERLLILGEKEGLAMQRGRYHAQHDVAGGFLRYRMSIPAKGQAGAIQRYITTALVQQANLALDSVELKRARPGTTELEARIDWILLATLPPGAAGASR